MPRETKMNRILINIKENDINHTDAVEAVLDVVSGGKVCYGAKNRKHYAWETKFENGLVVYTQPKYWSNSETFIVTKNEDTKNTWESI
jgi:hypothetical protein